MTLSGVDVIEVRVLEGPNLYFTRPAIKVELALPGFGAADPQEMRTLATQVGLGRARPGAPGSQQRQRFLVRLVQHVTRRVAGASGFPRLPVHARQGNAVDAVVVAYPWRHRDRALATGRRLGPVLAEVLAAPGAAAEAMNRAGTELSAVDPGPGPATLRPRIPVVAVTGTNGKTTTTRLLAAMGMGSGFRTGWSSTDGVLVQGEMIVSGDYSGPAGARAVLAAPGVQLGILETARGGMLLKGLGVSANDVSLVTNVTPDHLGVQGIDTLDQLAEVKSIITRVTHADGWVVLNGDDPRVWAMRHGIRARPWCFSLDAASPALRESLDAGGRGITVLDGDIAVLAPGSDPVHLVPVAEVPVALGGLSAYNLSNALAATAAALGVGMPVDSVVSTLRSFTSGVVDNPGRMNTWSLPVAGGTATVIGDMAHNEASLESLLQVSAGLRAPGSLIHLALGGPGDRSDEIVRGMGSIAGRLADRVHLVRKEKYLRERDAAELEDLFRAGLAEVGTVAQASWPDEMTAIEAIVAQMRPGDVLAVMLHTHRAQLTQWLDDRGATEDDGRAIARKVRLARGEHELDERFEEIAAVESPTERRRRLQGLVDEHPGDARVLHELAAELERQGQERQAGVHYREALDRGLRDPHRYCALVGLASSLRAEGAPEDARQHVATLRTEYPDATIPVVLEGLVLRDLGVGPQALASALDWVLAHSTSPADLGLAPAMARLIREAEQG